MKALRLSDDQTSIELHDEALPTVGRHEVLVRVHAASLNSRDRTIATRSYPGAVAKNVVPLSDGAGEVVAIGAAVTRAKVGDRVTAACTPHWISGRYLPEYGTSRFGVTIDGWLAEYALVHENGLVHVPAFLSYVEAASLPCAAVTAWAALHVTTPLRPGQTVLTQGTGGVALFGLQIARMFGARVLSITSSDEKAEQLRRFGAEAVVNYRSVPDWDREILALTNGKGVDKVIDVAGEATIMKSAASSKIGGEIGIVGFASGMGGGLSPIDIVSRALTIKGITVGPRDDLEALVSAMTVTEFHPIIDSVLSFSEYREAYRRLESGNHVGKVVIDLTELS
jgi:NADPH:quinone reductase-like Zn-dependent oxidoreductase